MKDVFLWILVGFMVIDFIVMAARWMLGNTDKITCGVLILVSITHGFFVIGGLFILTGVWK
jgi:hypothetical protein